MTWCCEEIHGWRDLGIDGSCLSLNCAFYHKTEGVLPQKATWSLIIITNSDFCYWLQKDQELIYQRSGTFFGIIYHRLLFTHENIQLSKTALHTAVKVLSVTCGFVLGTEFVPFSAENRYGEFHFVHIVTEVMIATHGLLEQSFSYGTVKMVIFAWNGGQFVCLMLSPPLLRFFPLLFVWLALFHQVCFPFLVFLCHICVVYIQSNINMFVNVIDLRLYSIYIIYCYTYTFRRINTHS